MLVLLQVLVLVLVLLQVLVLVLVRVLVRVLLVVEHARPVAEPGSRPRFSKGSNYTTSLYRNSLASNP